jgi:hypothetical protein
VAPFRRGRLITRAVFDLKANEGLNTHRKLEVVQALPKENVPMQPTEAGRLLVGDAEVALGRLATAEQQLAELAGYDQARSSWARSLPRSSICPPRSAGCFRRVTPN